MDYKPTSIRQLTFEMLECVHVFKIMLKSGYDGTPTWHCAKCHRKVKAS